MDQPLVRLNIQLPEELVGQLRQAANEGDRPLASEIRRRLALSFSVEPTKKPFQAETKSETTKTPLRAVSTLPRTLDPSHVFKMNSTNTVKLCLGCGTTERGEKAPHPCDMSMKGAK